MRKEAALRNGLIRLAYHNPELRPHLLPLVKSGAMLDLEKQLFTNPETGNKVKFTSLPPDVQKRIRAEHQQKGKGEKGLPNKPKSHGIGGTFAKALSGLFDKVKKPAHDIIEAVKHAPEAVHKFLVDPDHRKEATHEMTAQIRKSPSKLMDRLLKSSKSELGELSHAAKVARKLVSGKMKAHDLTKEDKHALYSAGVYVAGTVLSLYPPGSVLMAAGALGKSFAMHVGIKAAHHMLDEGFLHFEAAETVHHAVHGLTSVLSKMGGEEEGKGKLNMTDDHKLLAYTAGHVIKYLEGGVSEGDMTKILGNDHPTAEEG